MGGCCVGGVDAWNSWENEPLGRNGTGYHRVPPTVGPKGPASWPVSPGVQDAQRPQGIPHRADSGAEDQAGCVPDCYRGVAQHRTGYKHYFVPGLVGDGVGTQETTAIG